MLIIMQLYGFSLEYWLAVEHKIPNSYKRYMLLSQFTVSSRKNTLLEVFE